MEDRPTFIGNATKKARHFAGLGDALALADDSGLCVDALQGAPGVYSARYAGIAGERGAVDAANNAKLLKEMERVPDERRQGRFVCAAALAMPDADLAVMVDEVEGRDSAVAAASNGFGYDPLFSSASSRRRRRNCRRWKSRKYRTGGKRFGA